jgi:hypothetical protein
LATNRFITKLVLVDTGVSDFEELSKALIANQLSALAHIDLSSNRLSKASIVGLCRALRTRPVGVRSLLLSKVNITPASAALLVAALESHLRAALTIEHLDLSHNELGPKGSAAVSHFLVCLKGFGKLTWLNLSQTSLDVGAIAPVLGVLTTLQHVDISGNVLPPAAAADDQLVGDLCGVVALPQLRSASFAAMRLGAKAVQAILLACRSTSQRDERRLALDLSANELAPRDVDALVAALASVRLALVSLALADCRIGAAGLERVPLVAAAQRPARAARHWRQHGRHQQGGARRRARGGVVGDQLSRLAPGAARARSLARNAASARRDADAAAVAQVAAPAHARLAAYR